MIGNEVNVKSTDTFCLKSLPWDLRTLIGQAANSRNNLLTIFIRLIQALYFLWKWTFYLDIYPFSSFTEV